MKSKSFDTDVEDICGFKRFGRKRISMSVHVGSVCIIFLLVGASVIGIAINETDVNSLETAYNKSSSQNATPEALPTPQARVDKRKYFAFMPISVGRNEFEPYSDSGFTGYGGSSEEEERERDDYAYNERPRFRRQRRRNHRKRHYPLQPVRRIPKRPYNHHSRRRAIHRPSLNKPSFRRKMDLHRTPGPPYTRTGIRLASGRRYEPSVAKTQTTSRPAVIIINPKEKNFRGWKKKRKALKKKDSDEEEEYEEEEYFDGILTPDRQSLFSHEGKRLEGKRRRPQFSNSNEDIRNPHSFISDQNIRFNGDSYEDPPTHKKYDNELEEISYRPPIRRPPPTHVGIKIPGIRYPPNSGSIRDIIEAMQRKSVGKKYHKESKDFRQHSNDYQTHSPSTGVLYPSQLVKLGERNDSWATYFVKDNGRFNTYMNVPGFTINDINNPGYHPINFDPSKHVIQNVGKKQTYQPHTVPVTSSSTARPKIYQYNHHVKLPSGYSINSLGYDPTRPDGPDYSEVTNFKKASAPFNIGLDVYPIGHGRKNYEKDSSRRGLNRSDENKQEVLLHLNLFSKKPSSNEEKTHPSYEAVKKPNLPTSYYYFNSLNHQPQIQNDRMYTPGHENGPMVSYADRRSDEIIGNEGLKSSVEKDLLGFFNANIKDGNLRIGNHEIQITANLSDRPKIKDEDRLREYLSHQIDERSKNLVTRRIEDNSFSPSTITGQGPEVLPTTSTSATIDRNDDYEYYYQYYYDYVYPDESDPYDNIPRPASLVSQSNSTNTERETLE